MDVEKTLQVLAEVKDETTETLHHFEGKLLSAKLAAGPQRHIDNYTAGRDNAQERILCLSTAIAIIRTAKEYVAAREAFEEVDATYPYGVHITNWQKAKARVETAYAAFSSLLSSTCPSDGNS